MNINYALRLAIRKVLEQNQWRYMSAVEIRTAMHGLTPPQDFTEQQIALSIHQFLRGIHNDYEIKFDEERNINLYRIAI